jgi:hypothetical protein
MVTRMTTDKDRLATFMTAPPIITLVQNSRFRAPRNLPYRGAPSYKASIYYWWWEFLKRNCKYQSTCKRFGRGKLVISPFLTGCIRRTYAAIFSFMAGVMPPMPMLGRSLL